MGSMLIPSDGRSCWVWCIILLFWSVRAAGAPTVAEGSVTSKTFSHTIYLVRHAIAADASADTPDSERALTTEGTRKMTRAAIGLKRLGIIPDVILSSPLRRAFFYFLEDKETVPSGIIVFDELEKSQSHVLLDQMDHYFKSTAKGRQRSNQIIPEPFFVHSDLTTGVQLADLIAYIVSWGVRIGGMKQLIRSELIGLAEQVVRLRYTTTREVDGIPNYRIWGFAVINDLRAKEDKE